jgi:Domain of unknown function (DUF1707)/Domain of unknown function (DUF4333)
MMQPGSSYRDPMRASDADRAAVCTILDNAYTDGELDADEHRQRCSSAMSAKTRTQLLDLLSDLQTPPPVFTQQPTIAVNPNRKWIVGATVGGGVAAVAILGFIIAAWHSGSSPSPTAPVAAPTAPVAAPTAKVAAPAAPVPAPTKSSSSDSTGTYYLPLLDVVATVSGDFQDHHGHAPEHVNCPGDLDGRVGAFERCSIVDNGKRYDADVTVTAAKGNQITTHESINEVVPLPPSGP